MLASGLSQCGQVTGASKLVRLLSASTTLSDAWMPGLRACAACMLPPLVFLQHVCCDCADVPGREHFFPVLQVLEAVCQVHVPTLPPAVLRTAVLPEARAAVHRGLLQVRVPALKACRQAGSALLH